MCLEFSDLGRYCLLENIHNHQQTLNGPLFYKVLRVNGGR